MAPTDWHTWGLIDKFDEELGRERMAARRSRRSHRKSLRRIDALEDKVRALEIFMAAATEVLEAKGLLEAASFQKAVGEAKVRLAARDLHDAGQEKQERRRKAPKRARWWNRRR